MADEAVAPTPVGLPVTPFTAPRPEDSCMSWSGFGTPREAPACVTEVCTPMAAPQGNIEAPGKADGPGPITPWPGLDSDFEDPDAEDSQTEDSDGEDRPSGDLRFPATPDGNDQISFESLPSQASLTGTMANLRFYNGHGVSSQQDIQNWKNLELNCNDAGPHKLAVFGEAGNPDNPISFHHLGQTGMFEPIFLMPGTTLDGGSGQYQLPSDFPDYPEGCQPIARLDALLHALGARVHNDTFTSYY